MKLNYVIEFVADMDGAVKFYRDVLGCGFSLSFTHRFRHHAPTVFMIMHPPFS